MIDEARLIAADRGVDYRLGINDEQKGVIVVRVVIVVAPIRLAMTDAIAGIFDDARPLRNAHPRENAATVNRRITHANPGIAGLILHAVPYFMPRLGQTATGALIAAWY